MMGSQTTASVVRKNSTLCKVLNCYALVEYRIVILAPKLLLSFPALLHNIFGKSVQKAVLVYEPREIGKG
jgi:hypothetical protein